MYATPIPGLTVGDVFILLSWYLLIKKEKKIVIEKSLIFLIIYISISFVVFLINDSLIRMTTTLRYIIYLIIILYFPTVEENKEYAYKVMNKAGMFSMILLFVQFVALNLFGIIVPGLLTFLPLIDDALNDYSEGFKIAGRCMSCFAEPSMYAVYIVLFLTYRLFLYEGISYKAMKIPFLISLSIIFCSSFTGMIGMAAVWGLKLFYEIKSGRLLLSNAIFIIIVISAIVGITLFTSAGEYVTNEDVYETQSAGRFVGYIFIMEDMYKSLFSILFGNGMNDIGDEFTYLPGWPRMVFYFGVVGSIIYIVSFCKCAKRNTLSFVILIVMAGLNIGTEMGFGPQLLPYMLLMMLSRRSQYIKGT